MAPIKVTVLSPDQIRCRRAELRDQLAANGLTEARARELAGRYALELGEREILDELDDLDYLLGERAA